MHQIIIFDQIPDNMGIIGTGLISMVVIISGCKKIVDSIPSGNRMKTRYLKICYGEVEADATQTQEGQL